LKKQLLENKFSYLLVLLGLLGPVGYFGNIKELRGLGTAWMISPLPIVFSEVNNYEAFSSMFSLVLKFADGTIDMKTITPKEGSLIMGPYNRRNIYGAVLGYAPILPRETVSSVLEYSFCTNSNLKREFKIQKSVAAVELVIVDQTKARLNQNYKFGVVCGL
jgi:uncharacterized membrane protein